MNQKVRKRKFSSSSDKNPTSTSTLKGNKHKKKTEETLNASDTLVEVKKKQKKHNKTNKTNGVSSSPDVQATSSSANGKPTLKSPGFIWDIDPSKYMQVLDPEKDERSSDESSDDDEKSKKKKHKKSVHERREAARLEEERLQQVERDLLDPNRQLSSCDDFDRAVLAKPDSSAIWLQYMAFHLQATEIEKARAVAERALKSISYREEQEKLNIWIGLLNLENLYGTSETIRSTVDRALQSNEPYKIRAHLVRMYAESGKSKELESEVRLVTKKFKDTRGMWEEIGGILLSHGFAEKARALLQQALPHQRSNKDSVSLIVQFALMEARNNNIEQAKALMDPLLASYPMRIDIWFRYCDMLVKANQISEARDLYKRSVSQKLKARKMKALYSKFLQFEEVHGTKENQELVRSMAADYVKQVAGDN